jgi:hypothetical protein
MPRAPNAVFAIVALAACAREVVAPPAAAIRQQSDASVTALSTAPITAASAVQALSKSRTAGLDDVLARLIPPLGPSGLALRQPLSLLRDDLTVANSSARAALLEAADGAVDRFESNARASQQSDLSAIRLALDVIRFDAAASVAGQ